MGAVLVINATGVETRVALVENGAISEYYLERKKDKGIVGNIYKGKVVRVLPGMQAAFVDIGLEKAAFLYVSDVFYDPDFSEQQFDLTEGEHEEYEDLAEVVPEEGESAQPAAEVIVAAQAPQPTEKRGREEKPAAEKALEDKEPAVEAKAEEEPEAEANAEERAEKPICSGVAPALAPPQAPAPEIPEAAGAKPGEQKAEETAAEKANGDRDRGEFRVRGRRRRRGGSRRELRDQKPEKAEKTERAERSERAERPERPEREEQDREAKGQKKAAANIQDLLKVGQEIIVQVAKDPIGTKGARVTSHISLPGRHLVFMPTVDHVGISRRIEREGERRRLREVVDRLRPPGTGFIVRTVAENISNEKLEADARFLIGIWNAVGSKKERLGAPALMHPDLDLALRATRDLFAQDVEKLVIDDRAEWERIAEFVEAQDPALKERVVLHDSEEPIFDAYGIEHELQRAQSRKVWLKSGGYLIIDQAEALTAIDVNSGRYVGKKSLEETITRINTEASKEIVYQLRLRNIGGIIIIDFIDMDKAQNRDKVFKALQDALGRDKAKTNVLKISELGLIEMTRKRVRESLGRTLNESCTYCEGRGTVKSKRTIAYEIFREIRREATNFKESVLVVNCHPDVARILQADERDELRYLMDRYNKSILVRAQPSYHQEQFDLYGKSERPQKRGEREEPRRDKREDRDEREKRPEQSKRGGEEQGKRGGGEERGEKRGKRNEEREKRSEDREKQRVEEREKRTDDKRGESREKRSGEEREERTEERRVEEPAPATEVAAKPAGED